MKKFIEHKERTVPFDITPLIDVMFMLLLFFILTYNVIKPGISLELPTTKSSAASDKVSIVIEIDSHGAVYIDQSQVTLDDLVHKLQESNTAQKKRIELRCDKNVTYNQFLKVMGIVKSNGYQELILTHEASVEQ